MMDYHYQTMGRILAYLVNHGFGRIDLDTSNALEIMTERRGDEATVLATFADVLHWMLAEGLIRAREVQEYDGGYDFTGVQLTAKGISVIQAEPEDVEIGKSIQERVADTKPGELSSSIYTKIGSFVGGTIGGFIKSAGG